MKERQACHWDWHVVMGDMRCWGIFDFHYTWVSICFLSDYLNVVVADDGCADLCI